jgi:hypothetical protein
VVESEIKWRTPQEMKEECDHLKDILKSTYSHWFKKMD